MSIDPLKALFNPVATPPTPTRHTASANPQRGDFADLLEASEELLEGTGEPLMQARTAVHLAHLQLLQGLFETDSEPGSASPLGGFEPLSGLLPSAASQRHRLDNLYARLQPTLMEPKPVASAASLKRQDIEGMIDRVADSVSLAPELIRSVVAVESDFDPEAVSPVGAQGLMQLMPATAAELGVQDSFDPQQNLLGGSRYLKQLLDKYDGDLDHALAAYNWGQGNVDRKGLERMPEETRNYLVKVKSRLAAQAG